jgi:hypothetical protein
MFHFPLLVFSWSIDTVGIPPALFLPGGSVRLSVHQKIVSPPALNDIPGEACFLF